MGGVCRWADGPRNLPHLFSVEKMMAARKPPRLNKMPGIILANIHRINHPFHFGMFIYMGAVRSTMGIKKYIGGIHMKFVISMLAILLVVVLAVSVANIFSEMFSAYLTDLLDSSILS